MPTGRQSWWDGWQQSAGKEKSGEGKQGYQEITESVFRWKTESSRRRLSTCSGGGLLPADKGSTNLSVSVTKIKAEVLSRQRANDMEFIKNKRQWKWVSKPLSKGTKEKRIIIIKKSCTEDEWQSSYVWSIKGKLCCRYINTARGNVAAHE